MDLTYYGFATYVFLLVCIAIWLLSRLIAPRKNKKEDSVKDKEKKLFTLYQNVEDMLTSFEEYVEEVKAEAQENTEKMRALLEETRQLTREIKAEQRQESAVTVKPAPDIKPQVSFAAAAYQNAGKPVKKSSKAAEKPENEDVLFTYLEEHVKPVAENQDSQSATVISEDTASIKTSDRIWQMAQSGNEKTEIARQLGISVREVSLALKVRKPK